MLKKKDFQICYLYRTMADLLPKLKKHNKKRGSDRVGRRRSSVSKIEEVVIKIMETDVKDGFSMPEMISKANNDVNDDPEVEYEGEKRRYQ